MSFTDEQKEFLKNMFGDFKKEITDAMTEADKGVASSLTRKFSSTVDEIKNELKAFSKPPEDDKNDTGEKGKEGEETPAVKALKRQLEDLQSSLQAKDQAAKQAETKAKIRRELTSIPNLNQSVLDDLTDLLTDVRWNGKIKEDQGSLFIDDKTVLEAAKNYLESPSGSAYLVKPQTNGNGMRPTENNGKPGEKQTFESLMAEGLKDLI